MVTLVYNVVTTTMKFLALNKHNSQIGAFCHVVLNTSKKTKNKENDKHCFRNLREEVKMSRDLK